MDSVAPAARPAAPRTLEATGLPPLLVYEQVMKTLHLAGELTGTELGSRMGVTFSALQPALEQLRRDRHCEVLGGAVGPQTYTYRLTEAGHSRAAAYAARNAYVGRLPVPLTQYTAYMKDLGRRGSNGVTREALREAFKTLVLSDRVLDQLGPGVAARHSLFIYGPPGNGKTIMAHRLVGLLGGEIAVPHALAVDNEIVRVFDPLNHDPVPVAGPTGVLAKHDALDERWVMCHRPVVTVGGELRLDALELGYNASSGLYRAPLQILANGGVLVIDDFGRQQTSPREILNRWIVPLESRVDHLVLKTGQKFELPFDVLIVFVTNLRPLDLLDESFLRRIRFKVYAESPTQDEFVRIFENCCDARGLAFDRTLVDDMILRELEPRFVALRACQPRDLIEHALSLAEYTGKPRTLTTELLSSACATYFISDDRSAER